VARWRQAGTVHRGVLMAVNLSGRQLARVNFEQVVRAALDESGLDPESLLLEITESTLIEGSPASLAMLRMLRDLGVRLAIDDFGTGYSSLGYLKRFRVDALKIDRSFVHGLATDGGDSAIVAAVVSIARALGLSAIAEGVETSQQAGRLTELGCRLGQGQLFAAPQPAERICFRDSGAYSLSTASRGIRSIPAPSAWIGLNDPTAWVVSTWTVPTAPPPRAAGGATGARFSPHAPNRAGAGETSSKVNSK